MHPIPPTRRRALSLLLAVAGLGVAGCAAVPDLAPLLQETGRVATPPERLQAQVQAVRDVLRSLETGDPAAVLAHVSAERYIQHNHRLPDGRQALLEALPAMARGGTRVRIVRAFADGPFVVTHTQYTLYGRELIGFDIFRFEGGRIVEHWDNLAPARPPNASGRTMIDGPADVTDRHLGAQNKAVVAELMAKGFFGGDVQTVLRLIADPYHQHNPGVADGIAGLQAAMKTELARYDYKRVVRILGEGNFVAVVCEILYDGRPAANIDLFRLDNGKVVEHWDLVEPVAPESEWKNRNGKF